MDEFLLIIFFLASISISRISIFIGLGKCRWDIFDPSYVHDVNFKKVEKHLEAIKHRSGRKKEVRGLTVRADLW